MMKSLILFFNRKWLRNLLKRTGIYSHPLFTSLLLKSGARCTCANCQYWRDRDAALRKRMLSSNQ